jgi:hypothetical protein
VGRYTERANRHRGQRRTITPSSLPILPLSLLPPPPHDHIPTFKAYITLCQTYSILHLPMPPMLFSPTTASSPPTYPLPVIIPRTTHCQCPLFNRHIPYEHNRIHHHHTAVSSISVVLRANFKHIAITAYPPLSPRI